eukprot:112899-Alexandrium_andersonii.AAC.1
MRAHAHARTLARSHARTRTPRECINARLHAGMPARKPAHMHACTQEHMGGRWHNAVHWGQQHGSATTMNCLCKRAEASGVFCLSAA